MYLKYVVIVNYVNLKIYINVIQYTAFKIKSTETRGTADSTPVNNSSQKLQDP